MITFVCDLRQVSGYDRSVVTTGQWLRQVSGFFCFPHQTDRHDITVILLKVALNTINQTKPRVKNTNTLKKNVVYIYKNFIKIMSLRYNFSQCERNRIVDIKYETYLVVAYCWDKAQLSAILIKTSDTRDK